MASDLSAWQSLHPASVVVNLLPRTWRVIRSFWPFALALLWRGSADEAESWVSLIDAGILLLFFSLTVGGTVWHWLTLRYRVVRGRLEIRTGWINRKVRTIDPGRIQNVELVRNLPHRVSGLVEVRIETASGNEVEGMLSALTVDAAEALRGRLEALSALRDEDEDTPEPDEVLVENGPRELFTYAATAGRLGAAAVALGAIFEGITWLAPERLDDIPGQAFDLLGLSLAVAVLTGAWIVGLVGTALRHWGFRLSRRRRSLVVEGGLTTRRRLELPLAKVQVARTTEPLLRRWLGFGSVSIETAAARSGRGGTERRAALVPVVPRDELAALVRVAIPDLDVDPWTARLRRPHRRALVREVSRSVLPVLGIAVVGAILVSPWALLLLLLAPLTATLAVLDWRHQGWIITDRVVVARRGWLVRDLVVVSRRKLQAASISQSLLLRRLGLGRVSVRVAGTRVGLPLMGWDEGTAVVRDLAHPVETPPEPPGALVPAPS